MSKISWDNSCKPRRISSPNLREVISNWQVSLDRKIFRTRLFSNCTYNCGCCWVFSLVFWLLRFPVIVGGFNCLWYFCWDRLGCFLVNSTLQLLTCFQMVVRFTSSEMLICGLQLRVPFSNGSCRLSAECWPESCVGEEDRKWRIMVSFGWYGWW